MKYLKLFEEFTESALDWLISRGEVIEESWELVDERKVDYELEDAYDSASGLNESVSDQDTPILLVRYTYAPARVRTGPSGVPKRRHLGSW